MSWWTNEYVYPVSPKTKADIAGIAELVLAEVQPTALVAPEPIDVLRLVDHVLPAYGVHVVPVSHEELPDSEAETRISEVGDVELLLRVDHWNELIEGGRQAHRARATVAHETGHAVLHVPELRRKATRLSRQSPVKRTDLKAFRDPEWQAWTFALAFLMPLPIVRQMRDQSPSGLSTTFQVSEDLATSFRKRFDGMF